MSGSISQHTLAWALSAETPSLDAMHRHHGPLLEIARGLLGVVPNCHPLLALHEPEFGKYNVLVPNLLNVPAIGFSFYRLRKVVSLCMLASSWSAGCRYCTAHACTFAQLRGVDVDSIQAAMHTQAGPDGEPFLITSERIAIGVAIALGKAPSPLNSAQRDSLELAHSFSPQDIDRILCAIALMGWLNKMVDGLGVPLEPRMLTTASKTIARQGWNPGKHAPVGLADNAEDWDPRKNGPSQLRMLTLLPSVIRRSRHWSQGVPHKPRALEQFLHSRTGYHWPLITQLSIPRARSAIAAMLSLSFDPHTTTIGLRTKMLLSKEYATIVGNHWLTEVIEESLLPHAERLDYESRNHHLNNDDVTSAALALTTVAAPSPAQISETDVNAATEALSGPQIIETIGALADMQLLHRIATYKHTSAPVKDSITQSRRDLRMSQTPK